MGGGRYRPSSSLFAEPNRSQLPLNGTLELVDYCSDELEQGLLHQVLVEELHVERKVYLVYPANRLLRHAGRAVLEMVVDD
jgi:hypothetical protein